MSVEPVPGVLAGRVVLITGAHGGLGSAAALACARAGAQVVLLGRRLARLNAIYDQIAGSGPEPALYPLDLEGASPKDYAQMADRIGAECGRLDGVLHCAAAFPGLTALEHTEDVDFARLLHVNLTAQWMLSRACLPWLRRAEDAALVFVLDDLERVGKAFWGAYGIAQHGRAALVRMLAAEMENSPVRVSALQPGPMRTALRARAFFAEDPGQVPPASAFADAAVHLLSAAGADRRGQIWDGRA